MKKHIGRPKKPADHSKGELLQVRLEAKEKQGFSDAAALSGLALSSWVRERLRGIARQELEGMGKPIPFIP